MDIGTQRESFVCLTDNHWVRLRLGYAARSGLSASIARQMVSLLMATLMMLGIAAQAQAEGSVYPTREKTGYWAMLFSAYAADSTATSAAVVCEAIGKSMPLFTRWDGMVFVGTSPNATYYAGYEALDCLFRDSVNGVTVIQNAVFPVTRSVCPANSTRDAMGVCICNNNYNPDPTITSCVPVVTCPIDPLPKFPLPTDDSCTKSLEKGAGKDVDKVCPPLDDRWTKPNGGQLQCLSDKISKLGLSVPYTEPSATIRTVAYQQHLLAIWNTSQELKKLTDEEKLMCASLDAKVKGEMGSHGIDAQPSKKDSKAPHVLGKAIDIPRRVKNALIAKVSNSYYITRIPPFCFFCPIVPVYIGDVQDYVNSTLVNPPACNLRWGGQFDPYDPVHFQLP